MITLYTVSKDKRNLRKVAEYKRMGANYHKRLGKLAKANSQPIYMRHEAWVGKYTWYRITFNDELYIWNHTPLAGSPALNGEEIK